MLNNGHIRLPRSISNSKSPIFKDAELLKVAVWCYDRAAFKDHEVRLKKGRGGRGIMKVQVTLGQFIYGRDASADEIGMPPETLRGRMKKLVQLGVIRMEPKGAYTLVTVTEKPQVGMDVADASADSTPPYSSDSHQPIHHLNSNEKGHEFNEINNDDNVVNTSISTTLTQNSTPQTKNVVKKKVVEDPIIEKENIYSASGDAPRAEPAPYKTAKGRTLFEKRLALFNEFWNAFDLKKDRARAADVWLEIENYDDALHARIIEAARREAKQRPTLRAKKLTPIQPLQWLSARRWEDEAAYDGQPLQPVARKLTPAEAAFNALSLEEQEGWIAKAKKVRPQFADAPGTIRKVAAEMYWKGAREKEDRERREESNRRYREWMAPFNALPQAERDALVQQLRQQSGVYSGSSPETLAQIAGGQWLKEHGYGEGPGKENRR